MGGLLLRSWRSHCANSVTVESSPNSVVSVKGTVWPVADQTQRLSMEQERLLAIFEAKDLLAPYQPVLDDPVERSADQFVHAFRPHPRRHPHFSAVRELATRLSLPTLSMGMSGDFEAAIAEGSTLVRVGRAVFGPRP